MTNYTINAGDTLSAIARHFGVSVADIADANGITDVDMIETGATLTIPVSAAPIPQTYDQTGTAVAKVMPKVPVTANAMTFNIQEWLKPPKLYYVLGAIALGLYLYSDKKRR